MTLLTATFINLTQQEGGWLKDSEEKYRRQRHCKGGYN